MTSEPRTPSTPQSLAQLRDDILERHRECKDKTCFDAGSVHCTACISGGFPCDAVRLATLLSVENVAAGLHGLRMDECFDTEAVCVHHLDRAAALLEAIGASHD